MNLKNAAIEYTIGQYFSSCAEELGKLKTYELLQESVEQGVENPDLIPWAPFEFWTSSELLEQIDSDVHALTVLLRDVQDAVGVPE